MNFSVWFLIIVFFILVLIFFYLSYGNVYQYTLQNNITVVKDVNCAQPPFDTLINLDNYKCCYIKGQPTSYRYISEPYNVIVGNTPVNPYEACAGFCEKGTITASTKKCINDDEDNIQKYNNCLSAIQNSLCNTLSIPIAHLNSQYFYVTYATKALCENEGICVSF